MYSAGITLRFLTFRIYLAASELISLERGRVHEMCLFTEREQITMVNTPTWLRPEGGRTAAGGPPIGLAD